jgi:hypothetical protein
MEEVGTVFVEAALVVCDPGAATEGGVKDVAVESEPLSECRLSKEEAVMLFFSSVVMR